MNNVNDYLDSHILNEVRKRQNKARFYKKLIYVCVGIIPVCIILILIFHYTYYENPAVLATVFLLPFPAAFYIVFLSNKFITKQYRIRKDLLWDYAINDVLSKFFDVSEYNRKSRISDNIVIASNVVRGFDHIIGRDHLKGKYKERYFEFSEMGFTRLERYSDESGGGSTQVLFFSGPWFVLQFNKLLPGRLLIREKNKKFKVVGNIGQLKKTTTSNEEFNERFNVYTDDEATLSYILTPDFISALLEKSKSVGSFLNISLEGGRLYLAFNSSGLFTSFFDEDELYSINKIKEWYKLELQRYTDIIDLFIDSKKLDI